MVNLKKIRELRGLTQQQVCDDLDFQLVRYQNWEQLRNNPKPQDLCKIGDYLNCSLDELMGRDPKYYEGRASLTSSEHSDLAPDEKVLVGVYRLADSGKKQFVLEAAKVAADAKSGSPDNSSSSDTPVMAQVG